MHISHKFISCTFWDVSNYIIRVFQWRVQDLTLGGGVDFVNEGGRKSLKVSIFSKFLAIFH